jgi:hypothetical protein
MWASFRSHLPHQGVDFRYPASITLRCPPYLFELGITGRGPPLLGDLPGDRMLHGSGELQEDDRTAAFEIGSQLDPRTYPRDDGSLRGPQRHRPVAYPARYPSRCG